MNPAEYSIMAELEAVHWWYRGLREALGAVLDQPRFHLPSHPRILDAGCGTGANLDFLSRRYKAAYLGGFDFSPLALEASKRKVPEADLYRCDLRGPELRNEGLDLILSCDAISMVGDRESRDGLSLLARALRPGGIFVVNLPAYGFLYGEHDVAVHTVRRFTASSVRSFLLRMGLRVEYLSYQVSLLFFPIVLARLPSLLRPLPDRESARGDVSLPRPWLNDALVSMLRWEARLIARAGRIPFGTSVLAVARRRRR